jgi:hypothetical protein
LHEVAPFAVEDSSAQDLEVARNTWHYPWFTTPSGAHYGFFWSDGLGFRRQQLTI